MVLRFYYTLCTCTHTNMPRTKIIHSVFSNTVMGLSLAVRSLINAINAFIGGSWFFVNQVCGRSESVVRICRA